jgi:diguanylate cyclase (GGDEF)-like protein/PAS domain S-box-containing protein
MPTRRLAAAYAAWMGLLTVAYYVWPQLHILLWGGIGLTSSAAVFVGVVVNRPRKRWPWYMLGLALVAFGGGDFYYNLMTDVFHQTNPYPSFSDVLYLAMYPLLAAGLLGFIRSRTGNHDRGSLLDAVTLTVGMALLSWIFLIDPYVRDTTLTLVQKVTSISYPLGDVLTLATVARMLTGGVRRARSITYLGVGVAGLLVADVIYGLIQLNGHWMVGGPTDLGWVACYAFWGLAALDPSMTRLTEPARGLVGEMGGRRIALLGTASLIAPAALLVEASLGSVDDAPVIAVLSGVMFVLVLARLAGVMGTYRQSVSRERGLRESAAALVSAADLADAATAVRQALVRLLPPGTPHTLILQEPGRIPAEPSPHDREGVGHAQFVRVEDLDADLRTRLGDFPSALRCPLVIDGATGGAGPAAEALYLAAPEALLLALQGAVEVLASQAAIALDRISLTDEVNRRGSEAYFRTLIHNTSDVILIVDDGDRISYASPSAGIVFGDEELTGVPLWDLLEPDDRPRLAEVVEQIRVGITAHAQIDLTALRVDGSALNVEIDCRDLRADPTVRGLVLTARDVTERRRLENQLIRQAFHDSLTGLANRVLFQDRVDQAVARAKRDPGLVGVLFIDLDDFKVVNDTLGHAVGDELLIAVADRITSVLRPHDTAARLGGDEFAALIEDVTSMEDLERAAERLVTAMRTPFVVAGETVSGVASVGLSTTADAGEPAELLRQADLALYVAKGAGKGRWRRYQSDLHTAVLERLELRAALDHAVTEEQFILQYQPIVDLDSGVPVGFEALVRWQHPTRGIIAPSSFIEVAEESGLIVPIGRWVLRQALATAGRWQRTQPPGWLQYISVNVSARQFRSTGFVDEVRAALVASGVQPGTLMLEITESLLLRDDDQIRADLNALRELGVRLAIDDFGTGYSSLSYLRQMPIDVLKIDKSFIDDMVGSRQQRAVVGAIVQLAQTLDLAVVAEGIEEVEHRDLLRHMGCPYGQGYLFSRPLSEMDILALYPAFDSAKADTAA